MNTKKAALKRCPFCGGNAELYDSRESGANVGICHGAKVRCTECGAYGRAALYEWTVHNAYGYESLILTQQETREIAIIEWNARSPRQYRKGRRHIAELLKASRTEGRATA